MGGKELEETSGRMRTYGPIARERAGNPETSEFQFTGSGPQPQKFRPLAYGFLGWAVLNLLPGPKA
jgi:hypothetical protein